MCPQEVSLDKATVLTTIFTIVDDVMKESSVIQSTLLRPDPPPQLTDSEVVTIAIYQEIIGEPREDHFLRLHGAGLLTYFPLLNERSRYNRRKRSLWSVILAIRMRLTIVIETLRSEALATVDSAPNPVLVVNEINPVVTSLALPTMAYAARRL